MPIAPFALPLAAAALGLVANAEARAEDRATPAERAAFTAADTDRDGALSKREFEIFVRALAARGEATPTTIVRLGVFGIAFARADRDGDGLATPEELRAADAAHRE